jgi:hypothetical protein
MKIQINFFKISFKRKKKFSESSQSVEEDDVNDTSPISWPHRRWASITEKPVADEEDAADIIINLGGTNNVGGSISESPSIDGLLAADCPAVGLRLSQSASATSSGAILRLNNDDHQPGGRDLMASPDSVNNEAYYKLQSLGIIVSKASNSADIL